MESLQKWGVRRCSIYIYIYICLYKFRKGALAPSARETLRPPCCLATATWPASGGQTSLPGSQTACWAAKLHASGCHAGLPGSQNACWAAKLHASRFHMGMHAGQPHWMPLNATRAGMLSNRIACLRMPHGPARQPKCILGSHIACHWVAHKRGNQHVSMKN